MRYINRVLLTYLLLTLLRGSKTLRTVASKLLRVRGSQNRRVWAQYLTVFTSSKAEFMRSGQLVCHSVVLSICVQLHAKKCAWNYMTFLLKVGLGPVST